MTIKAQPKWRKAKNEILPKALQVFGGISDAAIEKKTGITSQTIRNWRSGRVRHPSSGTLNFLFKKYGVNVILQNKTK